MNLHMHLLKLKSRFCQKFLHEITLTAQSKENSSLNSPGSCSLHLSQENHFFFMFGTHPAAPNAPSFPKNHKIDITDCQYPSGLARNLACLETFSDSRSRTAESAAWPYGSPLSPPGRVCQYPLCAFTSRFHTPCQSTQNLETTPSTALLKTLSLIVYFSVI